MIFLRSKNAKILSMIAAMVVVLIIVYSYVVSSKDEKNKTQDVDIEPSTKAQKVLEKDLEKNYPASVREVVKQYCEIVECLYSEELSEDDFAELADMERELMDEELLENNTYGEFFERLQNEVNKYKKNKMKISGWEVEDNKKVTIWYNDDRKCASIRAVFTVSGEKVQIVREEFILRLDEDGKWKILGWKEYGDESVEEK